ncbi:MAG: DUF4421 family protein [Prevotella sp.]|nr:DUF4421 family protein [Prevotella sp.]
MRKNSFLFSCILICMVVTVQAQEKESWARRTANTVKQQLDSALFRKVDTSYIEVPQKPWRVILRPKVDQLYTTMNSSFDDELLAKLSKTYGIDLSSTNISWDLRINQPLTTSVGVWVGYRGLGIGYSQSLTKRAGRYFTLSTTGSHYGLTFTLRRFSADDMTVKIHEESELGRYDDRVDYKSYAPFWVRSVFVDGYYVFSGRRYSQAAAYNQSVIQRRSAGSFLLGLSWYQSSLDFSDRLNGEFIVAANDVGKIKVHQGNIGFGYGYNWVPARNWLFNIMVMPTVSVYNRVKVTKYDFNYDFATYETSQEVMKTYGEWDSEKRQWANGKKEKPMFGDIYSEEYVEDLSWQKDVEIWESGSEIKNTRWRVNINARAGITYYGKNWFASINGQLHRFSYKHNETGVKLYDWYIRGAFGMRF